MKINITIEIIGNPFFKNCWEVNPIGWSRRQRRNVAQEIAAEASDSYVRQVRALKNKAKENGFDLGLKETSEIVKRMHKEGFLERKTYS